MVTKAQAEAAAAKAEAEAADAPTLSLPVHSVPSVNASVPVLLAAVLRELPAIGKDSKMTSGGTYNYRSIEDILPVLNLLLSKYGLVPVLHEVYDTVETIRQTKSGGVMFATRLKARWLWVGPLGDSVMAGGAGEAADNGDKGTQKALTSAYKYMLTQTFAMATEEAAASDIDHYSSADQEAVLTPQQERKAAFEKEGKSLPEGWASFDEFDETHQTILAGVKAMTPEQQAELKAWRAAEGVGWPMTTEQMDAFIGRIADLKSVAVSEA